MEKYDIAIIGGGPGGYVAAIKAAQNNLKTVLIEKEHLGGICLNWGCIPTKALLKSAEVFKQCKNAIKYGIIVQAVTPDITKIVERSRSIASQLNKGIAMLMKKNKIDVIMGEAKLVNSETITVNSLNVYARNIIIATGARPRVILGFEPDGKLVWNSRHAMIPSEIPKSIIIVGSGAIGIEFASFYNTLGTKVVVLEALPRILPLEDEEISNHARKSFEKDGIEFYTGIKLNSLTKLENKVIIELEGGKRFEADRLIMAVGVVGNTENLGLENTKIQVDRNFIITDSLLQTHEKSIYAIGDVTGSPCLAHKASHEGIMAVTNIMGHSHTMDKSLIPSCTYSLPQIANIGLKEKEAIEKGYKINVGRFPFIANGKALAISEPEGLIKTIFDSETGEILGAHMIGADVTELISSFVIAKTSELTEIDLMHAIFPHPTLSEMLHESVLDAFKKAIHI